MLDIYWFQVNPDTNNYTFASDSFDTIGEYCVSIRISTNGTGYPYKDELIIPPCNEKISSLSIFIEYYHESLVEIKEFIYNIIKTFVNLKKVHIVIESKFFNDNTDFQNFFSFIPCGIIENITYVEKCIHNNTKLDLERFQFLNKVVLHINDISRLIDLSIQNKNIDVEIECQNENIDEVLQFFICKTFHINGKLINPIYFNFGNQKTHERIYNCISKYL